MATDNLGTVLPRGTSMLQLGNTLLVSYPCFGVQRALVSASADEVPRNPDKGGRCSYLKSIHTDSLPPHMH